MSKQFPSPLEDWVVSYIMTQFNNTTIVAGFPAPLEDWVGYYRKGLELSDCMA